MAAYGGSEEYLAGLGNRGKTPEQDDYIQQLNRGSDRAADMITRAGDARAQGMRDYWTNLTNAVDRGYAAYDKERARQTEEARYQAEQARQNKMDTATLQQMEDAHKQAQLATERGQAENAAYLKPDASGKNYFDWTAGKPASEEAHQKFQENMEQNRYNLEKNRDIREGQLHGKQMTQMDNAAKLFALEYNDATVNSGTRNAEASLYGPIMKNDRAGMIAAINDLRAKNIPEESIQAAYRKVNADKVAASNANTLFEQGTQDYIDAHKAHLEIRNNAATITALEDARDIFQAEQHRGKELGAIPNPLKNSAAGNDAANQFAAFLDEQGKGEMAKQVREGFFNADILHQMDSFIAQSKAKLNHTLAYNQDIMAKYAPNHPDIAASIGIAQQMGDPAFQEAQRKYRGFTSSGLPRTQLTNTGSAPQSSAVLNNAAARGGYKAPPQVDMSYPTPGAPQPAPQTTQPAAPPPAQGQQGYVMPVNGQTLDLSSANQAISNKPPVTSYKHLSRGQ